jgi:hypothetical protein
MHGKCSLRIKRTLRSSYAENMLGNRALYLSQARAKHGLRQCVFSCTGVRDSVVSHENASALSRSTRDNQHGYHIDRDDAFMLPLGACHAAGQVAR